MTTVQELIDFLNRCPKDAIVFTNQFGGDWAVECPVDLTASAVYPDAWVDSDKSEYYTDTKQFESDIERGYTISEGWSQQTVVRLTA